MQHLSFKAFCARQSKLSLRVLGAGYAKGTAEEWNDSVVSPGYSRLYYILRGDAYVAYDGRQLPLEPLHCYLFPTGRSLRYGCHTEMEQIYFHINLLNESGYDLLRGCTFPMCDTFPPELPERLACLAAGKDIADVLLTECEVLRCLAALFRKYGFFPDISTLSPCVEAAVEFIGQSPSIQLTLPLLAERAFVSESQLAKKFRAEIGKPIGRYIDDMVFFRAEQLLSQSALSIAEIGARLGFCDQFYFSRRFKEKYGVTPQHYRKSKII